MRMVVDLPAPFGPSSPKASPRPTENTIPSTARNRPSIFVNRRASTPFSCILDSRSAIFDLRESIQFAAASRNPSANRQSKIENLLSAALFPVGQELLKAFVRERVLYKLLHDLVRHGGNIGAEARALHYVYGMAYAGGE